MKNLSHTGKWILGILTFLHLLGTVALLILAITHFLPEFITMAESDVVEPAAFFTSFAEIMIIAVLLGLLGTGLMIYYIFHAAMNVHLTSILKVLWIVLFLFFGAIPQVIYFFMEITPVREAPNGVQETIHRND